jgi:phosphatidylglycerophosphatase A
MRHGSRQGVFAIKDHCVRFIATGGGIGYFPVAPGTWGSLLGCGLFLLLGLLPPAVYGIGMVLLLAVGIWTAGEAEKVLGHKDAPPIVIDEIVGMLVTYFMVPVAVWPVVVGFVLFRLFDILKPMPQLERLSGGWGIMLDDLLAGFLAQGGVRLLLLFA